MQFFSEREEQFVNSAARIGKWKIEFVDGDVTGLFGDSVMDDLLGVGEGTSPVERVAFFNSHIFIDDAKVVMQYLCSLTEAPSEVEYRYIHPTLGIRLVRCSGVLGESVGNKNYLIGWHQDITDVVRLQYQEEFDDRSLARLTQRLYGFSVTVDLDTGNYSFVPGNGMSHALDLLKSFSNYNDVKAECAKFIHPDYLASLKNLLDFDRLKNSICEGLVGNAEYPIFYPDMPECEWHELSVFVDTLADGKRFANLLGRDVTSHHKQREQMDREIKAVAARNQVLSDITRMLYGYNIVLNLETGEFFVIKGTGMDNMVSLFMNLKSYEEVYNICCNSVLPEFRKAFAELANFDNLCKRKDCLGFVGNLEYAVQKKSAVEWHEVNVFISTDELGNRFANLLGRNVSERHEKAEIKAQLEIATRASEAKTSFLFNMSHDIRTPMNAIMGFTDLIAKNAGDENKVKDYVKKIQSSNSFLLSLINNVLEMSRIESGQMVVDEGYLDAAGFRDSLYSIFADSMKQKGLDFKMKIDVEHDAVLCDATKIREICLNLISNSFKYTPAGGWVSVGLFEEPCSKPGMGLFKFIVEDNGIGMSREYVERIFDEFTRERTSTESRVEGSGLGMAIVKKLVDLLGGDIKVESSLEHGTKFTVTLCLKIAPRKNSSAKDEVQAKKTDFVGKRILLVEDNPLNAEIAISILTEVGFVVEWAEDGLIGVDKVEKSEAGYYDLILMDVQMPNLNGYGATEKIRALPDKNKANVPIVAMTANAFEEDRKAAINAGMNGHLAKPIHVENLMKMLTMILE